jgi:hypothetical protein
MNLSRTPGFVICSINVQCVLSGKGKNIVISEKSLIIVIDS